MRSTLGAGRCSQRDSHQDGRARVLRVCASLRSTGESGWVRWRRWYLPRNWGGPLMAGSRSPCWSTPTSLFPTCSILVRPEQKAHWLPRFATGELIAAIAITEPDAGSDVAAIRTTARREGDGFVINGTKMFITNGAIADVVFVAAKTNPDVKGSRGVSIFAVEKGANGFSTGRILEKMGWRASDTTELVFEEVWVDEDNLIGEENQGFYYIM